MNDVRSIAQTQLSITAFDGYLTDQEADRLVRIAQSVPYDVDTDTYRTTPEADDAMAQLIQGFLPLIHKVARTSRVLEEDEALQTCLEEFLTVVRDYEVGSALPFKAGVRVRLMRVIGDTGRTSGLIAVKKDAVYRYRLIMDKHGWNLDAAYADCVNYEFTKDTFLAVHRALGIDSLDVALTDDEGNANTSMHEAHLIDPEPSPEAQTVQTETVRYLLGLVPHDQESIVRLAYGFSDLPTENARLAAGLRADGSPLTDREVAIVLGMTTPTVNRRRNTALQTMREALADDDEADATSAA